MPITFRSAATDNNPVTTLAAQITVPRPTGVVDGDFLVASVAVADGSSSTITPPGGWTLVRRMDAGSTISLAVYTRFALGEPSAGWSWSFTNAKTHTAIVRAYVGVDSFAPVDADQGTSSASGTSPTVPSITASAAGMLAVESCACVGSVTITQPSGYVTRQTNKQTSASVEGSDSVLAASGVVAAATDTLGGAAIAVTHLMALRPSVGTVLLEQVRQAIKTNFPPGADSLYDWDNADTDIYSLTVALASIFKQLGFDYVDLVRKEFQPLTAVLKLADWEAAFGISVNVASAANSWVATRQNSIISKLRESGGSTVDNIRLAVEPLLGYQGANIGTLQVFECNRLGLTKAHTYANTTGVVISGAGNASQTVQVPDDGTVSASGVQLAVNLTTTQMTGVTVVLTSPGSVAITWTALATGAVTNQTFNLTDTAATTLLAKMLSGSSVTWTLKVTAGAAQVTLNSWSLFVEGAGPGPSTALGNIGLGGDIFTWGVYADPLKVNSPDYVGAIAALKRISPGTASPSLFLTLNPIPGAATTLPGAFFPMGRSNYQNFAFFPQPNDFARRTLPTAVTAQFIAQKLAPP